MIDDDAMGPILASQTMIRTAPGGAISEVVVDLGPPFACPPVDDEVSGDWACRLRIRGLRDDSPKTIHGVDAIQAITLALAFAGALLRMSPIAAQLDDAVVPNFGFPLMLEIPGEFRAGDRPSSG